MGCIQDGVKDSIQYEKAQSIAICPHEGCHAQISAVELASLVESPDQALAGM